MRVNSKRAGQRSGVMSTFKKSDHSSDCCSFCLGFSCYFHAKQQQNMDEFSPVALLFHASISNFSTISEQKVENFEDA